MSITPSLPDQPAIDQNLAWLEDLDPALLDSAFEQCKTNAIFAQRDFADTKEQHGEKVALADFNRRVLRWAQEFTNPRLARAMYVLGKAMSGDTHSWAISINGAVRDGRGDRNRKQGDPIKIAPDKLLDRYNKTYPKTEKSPGHTISYSQFLRYITMADNLCLVERKPQTGRQGDSDWHPGAYLPTITHVNFWCVLKDGKVVPHDFYARFPSPPDDPPEQPESKSDTGGDTGSDTGDDTLSTESYENSCSSLGQVKPKKRRDLLLDSKTSTGQPPAATAHQGSSQPEEYENSYWVERGTERFCKQSDYSREDKMTGERKLVHLTRGEAVHLWKTLRSTTDRRLFMMHKAYGVPLPAGQPKLVDKSRLRQQQELKRGMNRDQ